MTPPRTEKPALPQRLVDAACDALAWLHARLATLLSLAAALFCRAQSALPVPLKFTLAFLLLAALCAATAWFIPTRYAAWAGWEADLLRLLEKSGDLASGHATRLIAAIAACACLLAAGVAWLRAKPVLWFLKAALALVLLTWCKTFAWTLAAPAALNTADFRMLDGASRNSLWACAFACGSVALLPPLATLLLLALSSTRRWYARGNAPYPATIGDRFILSLRTGGPDPRFRTSLYWAASLFLAVLIAPFLIRGCGREEPYGLIKGDGAPEIEVAVVKRVQKPKKTKKLVVNSWSPYIFDRMDIEDTNVMKDLLKETLDTYAANTPKQTGKQGKKGKTAGWPDGMEGAIVRFIRLKYSGGDWDQDMGKGADYNLLVHFHDVTGFPIARDTEAIEISRLRRFPKGKSPPFVFLTGRGNINLSATDVSTLRWYLETEGGMLFIDHGGGHFDRSVRHLLSRVLPSHPLIDIANDDPIFQSPYVFPNGAPPFWHHAGNRALGVKIDGRWAVFYHPGDINDAWKDGHSGASPEVAAQAYKLGINVIYHAFNAYHQRHHGKK